jgi:hypothetical protein
MKKRDQYIPARNAWEFEKELASKPDVWKKEASNLRYSAEVLLLYDEEVSNRLFKKKTPLRLPAFFSARVIRMLMGFALENIVKAILLQSPEKMEAVFSRDGNLSWGRDGHNLLKLFEDANIDISPTEETYLELWQLCALWAGRYPLPANEHDLPRIRKPLSSREALLKRSGKRIDKALDKGDQLLGVEIHDLMHSGVGDFEEKTFREIFARCEAHVCKRG